MRDRWGEIQLADSIICSVKRHKIAFESDTALLEVRPRKDKRAFDLISDARPFGRLWYAEPNAISNAIGYAKFSSRIVLVRVLAPELEQAPNLSAQR
jgi:hypothetical protein